MGISYSFAFLLIGGFMSLLQEIEKFGLADCEFNRKLSLTTQSLKKSYGEFTYQADGRLTGHVLTINNIRRDGKFSVTHAYGSGRRINKIYTQEQLIAEIEKFTVGVNV
jgi:hypothetical protein